MRILKTKIKFDNVLKAKSAERCNFNREKAVK